MQKKQCHKTFPPQMIATSGGTYANTRNGAGDWSLNHTANTTITYLWCPLVVEEESGGAYAISPVTFTLAYTNATENLDAVPTIALYKITLNEDGTAKTVTALTATTENAVVSQDDLKVSATISAANQAFTSSAYSDPDGDTYYYAAEVSLDGGNSSVYTIDGYEWDYVKIFY